MKMDSTYFRMILQFILIFVVNSESKGNVSKAFISTTAIMSTTDLMDSETSNNYSEAPVSATTMLSTTKMINTRTTEDSDENSIAPTSAINIAMQQAYNVTRILSLDYKSVMQSSGGKMEGIATVIEGIGMTKYAERCTNWANCDAINFNIDIMSCELIEKSNGTITDEKGWINFKSLDWAKTNSLPCEKRPCGRRHVCVDQSNGDYMCIATSCEEPPGLPGASLTSGDYKVGKSLSYVCEKGVKYKGNPNIMCSDDGTWTSTTFECQCSDPPSISGITLSTERVVGTTIQYKCPSAMHTLPNDTSRVDTITCGSNGSWSSSPNIYCECMDPPPALNANISYESGRRINDTVKYQCTESHWNGTQNTQYTPHGDPYSYCGTSGWYSNSTFYCSEP